MYEYGNVTQSTQRISAVDNLKVKTNTSSSVSGNNQYSEYSNRQTSSYTKYAEFQFDDGKMFLIGDHKELINLGIITQKFLMV